MYYDKLSLGNLNTGDNEDNENGKKQLRAAPTETFILMCVHSVVAACIKITHDKGFLDDVKLPEKLLKFFKCNFYNDYFKTDKRAGAFTRSWELWLTITTNMYVASSKRLRLMFEDSSSAFHQDLLTDDPLDPQAPLRTTSFNDLAVPTQKNALRASKTFPVIVIDDGDTNDSTNALLPPQMAPCGSLSGTTGRSDSSENMSHNDEELSASPKPTREMVTPNGTQKRRRIVRH